ncbi:MAG: (Fe-S)-binding protein, partial [Oscillospiraceae bacterium]|nr:(Fe-S)-binding protein [Oscillospiraceae bacterium]
IRAAWERMGRPTLVFACASCSNRFGQYLPEISRVSLYELMEKAALPHCASYPEAAVFDPCAAREDDAMRASVRALAAQTGSKLEELEHGCRCCGYGGHIQLSNPAMFERISSSRAEESGSPYIVYCANCREVFLSRGKECSHILELYFGPGEGVPTLYQKRENALRLKKEMLKEIWNMDFTPDSAPWDGIELLIPPEIQASMEKNLISADDIRETLWRAEQSGDKLVGGGYSLASLRKNAATYWVQYSGEGGAYRVAAAYSHRMKWRE